MLMRGVRAGPSTASTAGMLSSLPSAATSATPSRTPSATAQQRLTPQARTPSAGKRRLWASKRRSASPQYAALPPPAPTTVTAPSPGKRLLSLFSFKGLLRRFSSSDPPEGGVVPSGTIYSSSAIAEKVSIVHNPSMAVVTSRGCDTVFLRMHEAMPARSPRSFWLQNEKICRKACIAAMPC